MVLKEADLKKLNVNSRDRKKILELIAKGGRKSFITDHVKKEQVSGLAGSMELVQAEGVAEEKTDDVKRLRQEMARLREKNEQLERRIDQLEVLCAKLAAGMMPAKK